MKKKMIFLFFCLVTCGASKGYCQEHKSAKYDIAYNNENVVKVLKDLEKLANIKIYYKKEELEGIVKSLDVKQASIMEILNVLFSKQGFYFTTFQNDVFITKQEIKHLNLEGDIAKNTSGKKPTVQEAKLFNKLYEIGIKSNSATKKETALLTGHLIDEISLLPVPNGMIASIDGKRRSTTDKDGFFSIILPIGLNNLVITANGYKTARRQLMLHDDGSINLSIKENIEQLTEVKITSQRLSTLKNLEMGVNRLGIETIKQVPTVFGEADVLRVVLTLPGVQSVGEASTGFNVRGGGADQNLILLNNSTIYNPAHFFGFFSAFNPDLVKDVQLYKSTIPERLGGRLSSVLEVTNRVGDKNKIRGSAGIGMITSRFNIEGPIDSGKTSFTFGGRATYSNWLLDLLPPEYKNSSASFYDLNFGLNHKINDKNELDFGAYHSRDGFKLNSDTSYNFKNKNAYVEWRRGISQKVNAAFKFAIDNYSYGVSSDGNSMNAYSLGFDINQFNVGAHFKHELNSKHSLNYGVSSIYYKLNPGNIQPNGSNSLTRPDMVDSEKALETAIFFGDEYKLNDAISLNFGLRYSLFNYLGPGDIAYYPEGQPKLDVNVIERKRYRNNEVIKTYHGPEFRLAGRYSIKDDMSLKASFNTMRQYIHLLSNTMAISPTDIWKLSDPNIKPQFGSQVSLGLYKYFSKGTIETSVETYYKNMKDYLDYRSGATLILNHNIEQDVISTRGKAYGVEVLLKKNTGKLNGWMSYTYSRTFLKMDDATQGTLVNQGAYYPANFDKPHAFNFVGNYKFKHRYHFSANFVYSTGRPITLPIAKYYYAGSQRVYYSDRNAYRVLDYLRMDVSFIIEGNHKVKQRTHNSWTVGVYNVTGRNNVFSTYFTQESGAIKGYNLSIFAYPIPFINYNIKF